MQWIWSLWGYIYAHQFTSFPRISNELREAYLAFFGTFPNLTNRRRSILPIHPAFTPYYKILSKITSLRFATFFISAYSPILVVSGSLKLTPPRIKLTPTPTINDSPDSPNSSTISSSARSLLRCDVIPPVKARSEVPPGPASSSLLVQPLSLPPPR